MEELKKKILKKEEVISEFNGIRLAYDYESKKYFDYLTRGYEERHIFLILMEMVLLVAAGCIILFSDFIEYVFWMIKYGEWSMILGLLFNRASLGIIGAFILNRYCRHIKIKFSKQLKGTLYVAECYAYEVIKREGRRGGISHYIKVTDNEGGYLEEEFYVDYKSAETNTDITAQLYVLEYNGEYFLDVVTEKMLEMRWTDEEEMNKYQ